METIILKENDLISIIESVIKEYGNLHKKHLYGEIKKYCIAFIKKSEITRYRSQINKNAFDISSIEKPSIYYLTQYYDGSCCFITKLSADRVRPVTFNTESEALGEIKFMLKHSYNTISDYTYKVIKYKDIEWK